MSRPPTGIAKLLDKVSASAQYKLGLMYKKGDGVEIDLVEAVAWFEKSSRSGVFAGTFPTRAYAPVRIGASQGLQKGCSTPS